MNVAAAPKVTWTDVQSSHIRRVAFCEQTERMGVEFKSGAFFSYEDVPLELYLALVGASSVGKFFDQVIKKSGLYDYEQFHSQQGLENKLMQHRSN